MVLPLYSSVRASEMCSLTFTWSEVVTRGGWMASSVGEAEGLEFWRWEPADALIIWEAPVYWACPWVPPAQYCVRVCSVQVTDDRHVPFLPTCGELGICEFLAFSYDISSCRVDIWFYL